MTEAAQATDPTEVIVTLTLQFKPGSVEEVLDQMMRSVRLTREEPGNNEFQLFRARGPKTVW